MIYALIIMIGAVLGALAATLAARRETAQLKEFDTALTKKNAELADQNSMLTKENASLSANLSAKAQEADMLVERLKSTEESFRQQLNDLKENDLRHLADITRNYEQQLQELKDMHATQLKDMTARHEREVRDNKELMDRQLTERLQLVQEQLRTATEQLLKQRSAELDTTNRSQMSSIIEPLKVVMNEMKKSMDDSRESFTRSTASLGEQLKQMYDTTNTLGAEAEKLSKALRTGPKVQGDFGEMKLNDLLDKFGFTRGVEYDVQYTMRDKKGNVIRNDDTDNMMRPDVILHYPDHKDVIIDSKASLTAFINYVNADDEETRRQSLDEHVRSMRRHVEELAAKNYGKYSVEGGTTLDFVIMFVPHEAAMQLALSADATLWSHAFDRNVLITGEQNLFALLRLLQMSWTQQRQAENQEQVFSLANTLLDRVGLFAERFERVGRNIDAVNKAYDDAQKSMRGNQSFIISARKLVEMGAKENARRPLPEVDEEPVNPSITSDKDED